MSLMYDDVYEPMSTTEIDGLLAEVPFDLIKANILEQIDDPMINNINYVNVIVEKCEVCRDMLGDDTDSIAQINESLRTFFIEITQAIDERFDLGLDLNELASSDSIIELGQTIYEYFIIRYKKNICKCVINYIKNHKSELVDYYSTKVKKDVTTLSHKKHVSQDDLVIISNLPSIIDYIVGLNITSYEFVDLSAGSANYNASVIKGLISANRMVGNFVRQYIDLSLDEHDYLIDEIQTMIKVKLISKIS